MVQVVPLSDRKPRQRSWTNDELAELYRVEHALVQAGIALETASGVSDEGDPWFIFCRTQGEVLVHIARYDGFYRLHSPAIRKPLVGPSFSALTKSFISGLRTPVQHSGTVAIHPAALLSVIVAAIFYTFDFHSDPARAAKPGHEGQSEHLVADPPTNDALNHTLLGSLTAFCSRSASEAVSFMLAKVESAAILIASTVAVLAEHAPVDLNILDPDSSVGVPVAQHQDGTADQPSALPDARVPGGQGDATTHAFVLSKLAAASDDTVGNTPAPTTAMTMVVQAGAANDKAAAFRPDSDQIQPDHLISYADPITAQDVSTRISDSSALLNGLALHQEVDKPGDGEHGIVNLTLASGNAASISTTQNIETVNVNLSEGGGTVDLSGASGVNTINVAGDGSLLITGIGASVSPEIILASHYDVSLSFGADAADASPLIKLSGQDQLLLVQAPRMPLTLDSEGSGSNTVSIADAAVSANAALDLTIVGNRELMLKESAAGFDNTQIDTSAFSGSLTIGLDLQNASQPVDLSKVAAASFIVDDGNSAVLQAAAGANIQLGSDLGNVEISIEGASAATPASLSFDMNGGSESSLGEFINLLQPVFASDVSINSGGSGVTGVNTIETLLDASLSVLKLTGDSPLTISAIDGPTAQGITIDAHELTAVLHLNVSDIANTAADGGSITIIGGSGWNVLTDLSATGSTTFILGPGENTVTLAAGSLSDTIKGLTGSTGVTVGSAPQYTDVTIDQSNIGTSQASIDGQTSLVAAAQLAAGFAGSNAAHQALLFTYQGAEYAFVDASGNHLFDAAQDAIIKLIGISAKADLSGIFHSA